jgi:hypothetical protein
MATENIIAIQFILFVKVKGDRMWSKALLCYLTVALFYWGPLLFPIACHVSDGSKEMGCSLAVQTSLVPILDRIYCQVTPLIIGFGINILERNLWNELHLPK